MTPPYGSTVAATLRVEGESLTLRQPTASGAYDPATGTQAYTWADTPTYGRMRLIETGIDGVTVQRGDLVVYLPLTPLQQAGKTPRIGDVLIRVDTGQQVRILEIERAPQGYYKGRARAVT